MLYWNGIGSNQNIWFCCQLLGCRFCFNRKEHEKCEFDVHEVYGVDVLISTGEGKVSIYELFIFVTVYTFSY